MREQAAQHGEFIKAFADTFVLNARQAGDSNTLPHHTTPHHTPPHPALPPPILTRHRPLTLSTPPCTLYQYTLSAHPTNAPYQHTLSTNPINTPCLPEFYRANGWLSPSLSIQIIHTPYQHNLFTSYTSYCLINAPCVPEFYRLNGWLSP